MPNLVKAAAAVDAAREQAWKEMSEPLRDIVEEIRDIDIKLAGELVRSRWMVGSHLDKVKKDPQKYGAEGTTFRLLTATLPQYNKDTLHQCHRFFTQYTDKQLEALLTARNRAGEMLTWSHVRSLITVVDTKARKQFQESALKENLTVDALNTRIQAFLGGGGSSSTNNGHRAVPKTLEGALRQIRKIIDNYQARQPIWQDPDHGLLAQFDNASPDKFDDKLVAELALIEEDLQHMQESLEGPVSDVRKLRLKAQSLLNKQKMEKDAARVTDDPPEDDEERPARPVRRRKPADEEE